MTSRVLEMEKTHIVYKFWQLERDSKDNDTFFRANLIGKLPVILVFNKGKVVKRYEGITETTQVLKGVKSAKEQKQKLWYPDWLRLW